MPLIVFRSGMIEPCDFDGNELPYVLAEIQSAAGTEAMLAIVERYGGRRVSIPQHGLRSNWLTDLVGIERATAIIDRLGWGQVEMPTDYAIRQALNRARFRQLDARGQSAAQIASELKVSQRAVHLWRQAARQQEISS